MAASLRDADDIRLSLYRSRRKADTLHFKVFRLGADIALSDVMPLLENMGLKVLTEHLYEIEAEGSKLYIQDIEVQPSARFEFDIDEVRELFQTAFERIWRGVAENDGFNKLILGAQLDWRQVSVLRGYCKYLLQTGVPFSQTYMEDTLNRYPAAAGLLVELFEAGFDPERESAGSTSQRGREETAREGAAGAGIARSDQGASALRRGSDRRTRRAARAADRGHHRLDQDSARPGREPRRGPHPARLSRRDRCDIAHELFSAEKSATRDGAPHDYISFKFDSAKVPDLPKPRPYREIFVYGAARRGRAPALRAGRARRPALVGSARGFPHRSAGPGQGADGQEHRHRAGRLEGRLLRQASAGIGGDRDAVLAEGVACYRMFINGLLDITDNLVDGKVVHPDRCRAPRRRRSVSRRRRRQGHRDVLRHRQRDQRASTASGSAMRSRRAARSATTTRSMGITAKGAWESVKRHFRALGRDCQTQDFTCVGIGDMSGDVFGNGMLLSRHIRLLAAFDHRHIFIDPDPDTAKSFAERERMFALPRSSWADYDTRLDLEGRRRVRAHREVDSGVARSLRACSASRKARRR